MTAPAVRPMGKKEARACVEEIKGALEYARAMILDLYERRGWESLGYPSWRACVVAEFDQSKSQLYRQLDAAKVEREISPMGEIGVIPERVCRTMVNLAPGLAAKVYQDAVEHADNGKPTARTVEASIARVVGKAPEKCWDDLVQAAREGKVTRGLVEAAVAEVGGLGGGNGRKTREDPDRARERLHSTLSACWGLVGAWNDRGLLEAMESVPRGDRRFAHQTVANLITSLQSWLPILDPDRED